MISYFENIRDKRGIAKGIRPIFDLKILPVPITRKMRIAPSRAAIGVHCSKSDVRNENNKYRSEKSWSKIGNISDSWIGKVKVPRKVSKTTIRVCVNPQTEWYAIAEWKIEGERLMNRLTENGWESVPPYTKAILFRTRSERGTGWEERERKTERGVDLRSPKREYYPPTTIRLSK